MGSSTGASATRSGASGWGRPIASADEYARNLRQFAAAMRKVDPRLMLIASGTDGVTLGNDWDKTIVAEAGDCFDWISLHHYSPITKALTGPEGAAEFTRQACQPRDGLLPWLREMRRAIDQSSPRGKADPDRLRRMEPVAQLVHAPLRSPMAHRSHRRRLRRRPAPHVLPGGRIARHGFGRHVPAGQRRPDPGQAVFRGPDGHGASVCTVACPRRAADCSRPTRRAMPARSMRARRFPPTGSGSF